MLFPSTVMMGYIKHKVSFCDENWLSRKLFVSFYMILLLLNSHLDLLVLTKT